MVAEIREERCGGGRAMLKTECGGGYVISNLLLR